MKPDLSKLSGEDLFDYYTSQNNDYKGVLFQAHIEIGDELFKMLEQAEKQGKKIAIKETLNDVDDPPITVYIE
jgi:hypothetical protein